MSEGQIPDELEHPMWRTPPEPQPQPTLAMEVASLVQGYIDDKIAELRFEVNERTIDQAMLHQVSALVTQLNEAHNSLTNRVNLLHSTIGSIRDGVAERLEGIEGQLNLPEHVYKNFIKSEAERLRIVKPVRKVEE